MSTDHTRALALALLREARGVIEQLGEREALHDLDNAIVDLLPDTPVAEPQRPRLRLVSG